MYKFSKLSESRLKQVHPDLVKVLKESIETSPYDFSIVSGFRTAKDQNLLYQKGRTRKGQVVTNCDGYKNKSNHQAKSDGYGYAIDFAIYNPQVVGKLEWGNLNKIRQVAAHIKTVAAENNIKIVWGGDWVNFKDYPHIELKK